MSKFTQVLLVVGVASVAGLVVYNIKAHRDNQEVMAAVVDLAQDVENLGIDLQFYDIVERYED